MRIKILNYINENPGVTLTELAYKFSFTKGNISIYLKKLEEEKLILKYKIPFNKNIIKLHPTNSGKNIYLKNKLLNIKKLY